jgi:ABC-2 type transport system permease protein
MGVVTANIVAIFRKELQSYLGSPVAYLVAAIFWLLSGNSFLDNLYKVIGRAAYVDQMGVPAPPEDFAYTFLFFFLSDIGALALFLLPLLSMGLYTEERKRGTLELLATSPVTNWAVAVGKLLGVLTFFTFMALPLLLYEAIALSAANPPIQPAVPLLAHAGLILLAASILALGMFISSLTDSTILAAFLTFALNFFLWIIAWLAQNVEGVIGEALSHLSLLEAYSNFVKGIFDPSSLILLASYIILGIFLTAQYIDALRFQRT